MTGIEGQIDIDIYPPHKKNTARVILNSSRPLQAAKIFIGKTPEQTLDTIPLLFNICGVAQSRAALAAIEKNLGIKSRSELETARDMLMLVENAKEHLLRIFIDWPELFKLKINASQLPYLSQMLPAFKSALFHDAQAFNMHSRLNDEYRNTDYLIDKLEQYLQQHVFAQNCEDWLQIQNIHQLQQWAQQCDSIAAHTIHVICNQGWPSQGLTDFQHLPELDEATLLEKFNGRDAQQFIAQPQWHGQCYETTTLNRQYEQPLIRALHNEFHSTLITRWLARLVELASIPHQLRSLQQQLNEQKNTTAENACNKKAQGLKQVEATRGRLIHHVEIKQGRIENYQILAPTEWNFHPRGLVAKSLCSIANCNPVDEIETIAHLMINTIDPCVAYRLRIH